MGAAAAQGSCFYWAQQAYCSQGTRERMKLLIAIILAFSLLACLAYAQADGLSACNAGLNTCAAGCCSSAGGAYSNAPNGGGRCASIPDSHRTALAACNRNCGVNWQSCASAAVNYTPDACYPSWEACVVGCCSAAAGNPFIAAGQIQCANTDFGTDASYGACTNACDSAYTNCYSSQPTPTPTPVEPGPGGCPGTGLVLLAGAGITLLARRS